MWRRRWRLGRGALGKTDRGLKILDGGIALRGLYGKRRHQSLLGGVRNVGADRTRQLNRVFSEAIDRRRRNRAGEEMIEGCADCIDVGPGSLLAGAAILLFRCVADLENHREPL